MFDLIIIGGGPAGITAAIYAARQKLNTLLITKQIGGQMALKAVSIENYPGFKEISGADLIDKFKQHLSKFDVKIEKDSVTKIKKEDNIFLIKTKQDQYKSRTAIVATGADPRPLEVPGEKEFIGQGVSYCAACDGPLFQDKKVAVIGGGNAGFESALFLAKYAQRVFILEYSSEVNAAPVNQERVEQIEKIKIITNAKLKEIRGEDFVNQIVYQDRKLKQDKELEVEGVFIEIGRQPATSFVKDLVAFNKRDEIKVDSVNQTETSGLFAAGDVTEVKYKQIVIAAGAGAKAALSAYQYLQRDD